MNSQAYGYGERSSSGGRASAGAVRIGRAAVMAVVLAAGLLVAGCQGAPKRGVGEATFGGELQSAAISIKAGELAAAYHHLGRADVLAEDDAQKQQARSLRKLADGASALMRGEVEQARASWAQIDDLSLRRQVRHRAQGIGVAVPQGSDESIAFYPEDK